MSERLDWAFKAVRRNGKLETGVVQAPSRDAAVALVGGRGAFVIDVSAQPQSALRHRQVGADDLALGLGALATLLNAGIPVARALGVLDDLVPPSWLAALPELRHRIEQGERFAEALEASPLPFPSHVIGIIQAGEAGSGLAAAVESAAQLLETRAANRAALRNALAYPAILAVAGSASVALLVGVVLPRFATLLADAGQTLPLSTRLVLALGAIAHAAWIPGLVSIVGAFALWRTWLTRPDARTRWHELLLSAPLVGDIRRSAAAANACSTLAALLDAGVPLAAALPHAARATGDGAVEARLLSARKRIGRGERISSALEAEGALTPTVVRLVRIGEETGRLPSVLGRAAQVESNHAFQRLQRLIRIVEPALILLFGGLVMLVAAALMQAIYGLRPSG